MVIRPCITPTSHVEKYFVHMVYPRPKVLHVLSDLSALTHYPPEPSKSYRFTFFNDLEPYMSPIQPP